MYFRSQKKANQPVSLDDTIEIDRDGNKLTYQDILAVDDNIADEIDKKINIKKAYHYIEHMLTPRERQILIMRHGLNGNEPCTQMCIAKKLGISRSYVSRIETGALERIKKEFNKYIKS
jgi:RNA polymerase sporulation-specific sigma factor